MAIEVFGPELAPYAAVACVISFLISGHRSVYDSQILAIKKTASVDVSLGKEMGEIKAHPKLREKGWSKYLKNVYAFLVKRPRNPKKS